MNRLPPGEIECDITISGTTLLTTRPALVLTLGGVNVDMCGLAQLQVLMLLPMLMLMLMMQVLVLMVTAMVQVMVQVLGRRRWRARCG